MADGSLIEDSLVRSAPTLSRPSLPWPKTWSLDPDRKRCCVYLDLMNKPGVIANDVATHVERKFAGSSFAVQETPVPASTILLK